MRFFLGLLFALLALPVFAAPQDITVTFTPPTVGGAPSGYRLFKDNVLVGPVTSGQTFPALLTDDGSAHVLGFEAFNTGGTGTRVNRSVTITSVVQPPGPVPTITITAPCALTVPATCTILVN